MDQKRPEICECHVDIDRMINEGLGGGFTALHFSEQQYTPAEWPEPGEQERFIYPKSSKGGKL